MKTRERIKAYREKWLKCGYPMDIPDHVPHVLMQKNLAPSYKAIALAILSNDINLHSLGFSDNTPWYSAIKRHEISLRGSDHGKV